MGFLVQRAAHTSSGKTWKRHVAVLTCIALLGSGTISVKARDDGRYANSPLKGWFDSLHSKSGGNCCSNTDGMALSDVDWDTKDGHYRVRLDGEWVDVPGDAVITEPNRAGRTMVWPYYVQGRPVIRCFLPGTMT
jgi:hypothetical protein